MHAKSWIDGTGVEVKKKGVDMTQYFITLAKYYDVVVHL